MTRSIAGLLLPALLLACSSAPPTPAPPAAPAAPAAPASAAHALPTAVASAALPAPPAPPSPFFPVIINAASSFQFYTLKTGGIAISGDWYGRPVRVDDKGARDDPSIFQGIEGMSKETPVFMVHSIQGDWPRSGSLSLNIPGERGGTDYNYTWSGASWVKAKDQPLADMPDGVTRAYYGGSYLGVATWEGRSLYHIFDWEKENGPTVPQFVLGGKGKGRLPIITRGKAPCPTRLSGYATLETMASGDLIGIGKLCAGAGEYTGMEQIGPGALAVERWPKGSTTSVIEPLPGSAEKGTLRLRQAGIHVVSPADVYVYASFSQGKDEVSPYVAHHDGKAWTDITPPAKQRIANLWAAPDGTLWIAMDRELGRHKAGAWERLAPPGEHHDMAFAAQAPDATIWARFEDDLWHLTAGGAWEKVTMPRDSAGNPLRAESVTWLGSGDMVVVGRNDKGTESALVSSRKPDKVLDLGIDPPEGAGAAKGPVAAGAAKAFGHVGPPTPGCKSLFVVLYKLSRVAPPDYDFPLTREALKGHTELEDARFAETEDAGSRYLVAFVPSLSRGQKLVNLIRDKVPSARPQMLCGEPAKINRALNIDLRTGALRK